MDDIFMRHIKCRQSYLLLRLHIRLRKRDGLIDIPAFLVQHAADQKIQRHRHTIRQLMYRRKYLRQLLLEIAKLGPVSADSQNRHIARCDTADQCLLIAASADGIFYGR